MTRAPRIFRARWVVPEPGVSIRDGAVVCHGGTVTDCQAWKNLRAQWGAASGEADVVDYGAAVILPGLINAHTHPELTDLAGAIEPTPHFTDWLRELMAKRAGWDASRVARSVQHCAEESLAAGVTCLGAIGADPLADRPLLDTAAGAGPRITLFQELISLDPFQAEERLAAALSRRAAPPPPGLHYALSPHAPYTVSENLMMQTLERSARLGEPVCVHVAETMEEDTFCRTGRGPIRDFLESLGVLADSWRAPGMSPVAWLARCGFGRGPSLAVHAHYASAEEMAWMAQQDVSICFCPPSHRFFGHSPNPLGLIIESGARLCIGTDSRASSETLDVLEAIRIARPGYKGWTASQWLATVTTHPAQALGRGDDVGRLRPGMAADLAVFEIDRAASEPVEAVLSGQCRLVDCVRGGRSRNGR